MTTFYKWFVTLSSGIAAGLIAYAQIHDGPPMSTTDWWKLLIVTLTVTGFGVGAKVTNKSIDKTQGK